MAGPQSTDRRDQESKFKCVECVSDEGTCTFVLELSTYHETLTRAFVNEAMDNCCLPTSDNLAILYSLK